MIATANGSSASTPMACCLAPSTAMSPARMNMEVEAKKDPLRIRLAMIWVSTMRLSRSSICRAQTMR
jgi:hypothetical protein